VRPSDIRAKEQRNIDHREASRRRPALVESGRVWLRRRVPERFHKLGHELAKFGVIGLINIGVNFAVVNLLWATVLSGSEVKAKAVATVVAATSAYFMNRHWTYRDRPKSSLRREYTLFFLFNLVGLFIEVAVLSVAKYGLHQSSLLVLNVFTGLGIVIGTVFRFWAYRTHVFKLAPDGSSATGTNGSRFTQLIRPQAAARPTPAKATNKATSKAVARTAHPGAPKNGHKAAKKTGHAPHPVRTKS
jgi:putative flippase GtrA